MYKKKSTLTPTKVDNPQLNPNGELFRDFFKEYRNTETSDISRIAMENCVKEYPDIYDMFIDLDCEKETFVDEMLKYEQFTLTKKDEYVKNIQEFTDKLNQDDYKYSTGLDRTFKRICIKKFVGISYGEILTYFDVGPEKQRQMVNNGFITTFVDTFVRKKIKEKISKLDLGDWTYKIGTEAKKNANPNIYCIEIELLCLKENALNTKNYKAIEDFLNCFKESMFKEKD